MQVYSYDIHLTGTPVFVMPSNERKSHTMKQARYVTMGTDFSKVVSTRADEPGTGLVTCKDHYVAIINCSQNKIQFNILPLRHTQGDIIGNLERVYGVILLIK